MSSALTLVKYYNEKSFVVKDKQFVMGISMGGFATWDIITRHSDDFAAAVPICGGCDATKAETLINVPVYTFHGALDPLVSPEGTQTMVKNIKDAGGDKIIYVEYADGYHDIWNDALSTEGLAEWINSKSLADR